MVLNERNSEMVRNGRRSRGPSPSTNGVNTGTHTPESSDDDNSIKRNGKSKAKQSEYEEKIRVGRDYQAVCPPLIPDPERKPESLADRALLVWSPTKEIADKSLEEYITMAKEQYGYNGEQALGMLFWHKHDLPRAISDLSNFTPFPDEWTTEDKVLFEQAFQFHGKSFHRIRQMLPDKTIASLVKYYYSWKKTRHRVSAMDRQEKKAAAKDSGNGSDNGSENGSNEDSENEDNKVQINKQLIEMKNVENNDDLRPAETAYRISARWTNEEITLAVNGVKQFGKDFQAIADILGNKTKAHVQTFYVNYRRRHNLDQLVKEYEARIAAEKADSNADQVKDEKKEKEEKSTPAAAPTTNESSSTEGKTPDKKETPVDAGKPVKADNNSSISSKKDVMEVELDNDEEDDGEPPAKKPATVSTTKSQEESTTT